MGQLNLILFGSPRISWNGQHVELNLHKAVALFVYLAVTKKVYSRDALATLFWPEYNQSAARANLRRTLYRINQAFGEDIVAASLDTIGLDPHVKILLDVELYRRSVRQCLVTDKPTDQPSSDYLRRLAEAVQLYTDDFLAGFTLTDAPAFDEWQFFETESLRQLLFQALQELGRGHQARGEFLEAIPYASRQPIGRARGRLGNLRPPSWPVSPFISTGP